MLRSLVGSEMCIRDRLLCKQALEHLETVNAWLLLTSLTACDWSGHIVGASASPRSLTKNVGMHNASRSLQRGESTIQPGEATANVFEICSLEKRVLHHSPDPVFLLLVRIYNLHAIRHNTSPPWSAYWYCTSILLRAYSPRLAFSLKKTFVVCCVSCSTFHTNCSVAAPEFLNSPGILRTTSQTCNNVTWSCLVDVHHFSPSMLFKTTSRVASISTAGKF